MASVVLQNGEDSYCFSWEVLKEFPDSLLANYAQLSDQEQSEACAAAEGAASSRCSTRGVANEGGTADRACSTVLLPVQQLPRSPLTDWPQAPAVAHCLYSHHCITLDLLRSMLADITGRTAPHFVAPYEQLSGLIAYLNLPGAVSRWLPDFSTVSLQKGNLLSLACNIKALEAQHGLPAAAAEPNTAAAAAPAPSAAAAAKRAAAAGPNVAAAGPSATSAGPRTCASVAAAGSSNAAAGPRATAAGSSIAAAGPGATAAGPSVAAAGPSPTSAGPWTWASVAAAGPSASAAAAGPGAAAAEPSVAAAGASVSTAAAGSSTSSNTASAQCSGSVEPESEGQSVTVRAAVEDAVRLMLSYKPYHTAPPAHAGSSQSSGDTKPSSSCSSSSSSSSMERSSSIERNEYHQRRFAVFAVVLDSKKTKDSVRWSTPLRVYVVDKPKMFYTKLESSGLRCAEITAGGEHGKFESKLNWLPLVNFVGTPNRSVAAGLLGLTGHIRSAFSSLAADTTLELVGVTAKYTSSIIVYDRDQQTAATNGSRSAPSIDEFASEIKPIPLLTLLDSMPDMPRWGHTVMLETRHVPLWAVQW